MKNGKEEMTTDTKIGLFVLAIILMLVIMSTVYIFSVTGMSYIKVLLATAITMIVISFFILLMKIMFRDI